METHTIGDGISPSMGQESNAIQMGKMLPSVCTSDGGMCVKA